MCVVLISLQLTVLVVWLCRLLGYPDTAATRQLLRDEITDFIRRNWHEYRWIVPEQFADNVEDYVRVMRTPRSSASWG